MRVNGKNAITVKQYADGKTTKNALTELRRQLNENKDVLGSISRTSQAEKAMAADIETTGLNPHMERIMLISSAGDTITGVFDSPEPLGQVLKSYNIMKVFHNAPFDVYFLSVKGYPVYNYECTMLMEQVLFNNEHRPRGGYGLAALVKKYFDVELDKTYQNPDCWQGFIFPEMREYCQQDSVFTLTLHRHLQEQIRDQGLRPVYDREARALPAIIRLQKDGMAFDAAAWKQDLQGYKEKRKELEAEVKAEANTDINLSSPSQLLTCLRNRGLEIDNTNDETLALHETELPVLAKLRQWRELNKLCTGYGDKLIKTVRRGRIHASWRLIGATTGRMSCSDPNLQQVPHVLRKYFKAPAGRKLVIADYSQIELRIVGEIANEKVMLEAFRKGEDLHNKTAGMILRKEQVSKDERQIAKACNFGLIYGMTPRGLQARARTAYGVDISDEDAEIFWQGFFRLYPAIKKWHYKQINVADIQTMGGRVWKDIPKPKDRGWRNRLNYPVQGTGAEGLKEALGLLIPGLPDEWKLCNVIHDEIVLEVPETEAEQARAYLTACMKDGMERLLREVPVGVDCKIADSWEK